MVVELAQDEMKNLVKVWLSIVVSLSYCYFIGKITPKGFTRLVAILPVIFLFLILPLNLTSVHFCLYVGFVITWLANFKLLLFAFGKPPLCIDPPISFPLYIALACLPIKISIKKDDKNQNPKPKTQNNPYPYHTNSQNDNIPPNKSYPSQNSQTSPRNYLFKFTLLLVIISIYDFSDHIPPKVLPLIYAFRLYFALEITLETIAKASNLILGVEIEPTFNEPLLSTSLQDFWGKRWNLMSSSILKSTVYLPTQDLFTNIIGRETASFIGVMASFIVSAIMHELIFYYIGRVKPTFEMTWFFLVNGLCLCIEVVVKYYGKRKKWWVPPSWLSRVATLGFTFGTGIWWLLPPLLKATTPRLLEEYRLLGAFIKLVLFKFSL